MAQFPMTEDRRKILERIPDYAVSITEADSRVTVRSGDQLIATSEAALLVRETRHDDVYYIPRDDVNMDLLVATEHSTYCPFKGYARYWSMKDGSLENFVWSYETPFPEVDALKSYMSFYTNRVDIS